MIQLNWKVYAGIAILIVGISLGIPFGRCTKKPEKPPVAPAITIHDTLKITIHESDTIEKYVAQKFIKLIHDTLWMTDSIKVVENCLSMEDSARGIHAEMKICSKELPASKPADLHGSLQLSFPPDTTIEHTKVVTEIHTVTKYNSSFWEDLLCVFLGAIGGFIGSLFL